MQQVDKDTSNLSETGERNWGNLRDEARQHLFRRLRTLGTGVPTATVSGRLVAERIRAELYG